MTNDEVFARAYTDHNPMLRRFLSKRVTDQHLVEDLLQETWTKVWGAIGRVRLDEPWGLEPWLTRIAHNVLTDHWRRTGRRPTMSLAGDGAVFAARPCRTVGPEERAVTAAEWADDLACLPPHHRVVMRLRCELEFTDQETADELGMPRGTVKSRLHYGRKTVAARRAAS